MKWKFGIKKFNDDMEEVIVEKPYEYTGPGYYENPFIYDEGGLAVVGCDEYDVFAVWPPHDTPGLRENHIAMILSAPELLDALELLLIECQAVQELAVDAIPKLLERAKDARMVVAKAKGEAS